MQDRYRVVGLLIANGADINVRGGMLVNALQAAVDFNSLDIADPVCSFGARWELFRFTHQVIYWSIQYLV
jgi:ankyrin repeat protein